MKDKDAVKTNKQKGLLIKGNFRLKNRIQSSFQKDACLARAQEHDIQLLYPSLGPKFGGTERRRDSQRRLMGRPPTRMQGHSHTKN